MTAKYRITETPSGCFKLGVLADAGDLWVLASQETFGTFEQAQAGLKRVIAKRAWYYDAEGDPIDG